MADIYLDSSSDFLAVGVCKDDNSVLLSTTYKCWQSQSEYMLPELEKLFIQGGIAKKDIKRIFVAIGPGSYTGVRIALTIAKTIAVALNADVYPISSLQILQASGRKSICLMDARSNRSYFAVYEDDRVIEQDQIKTNDQVIEYINSHPDYAICGTSKQLGGSYEAINSNVIENMYRLRNSFVKIDNPLSLKPVYMKG